MTKVLSLVTALSMVSATALATPISGSGLQNSIDAMGGIVDVQNEQASPDQQFKMGATGVAASRIQFELSAFAGSNSFGIYDLNNPGTQLTIFSGADGAGTFGFLFNSVGSTYCAATLATIMSPTCALFATDKFGFFLNTPSGTFYSERALNGDGVDHLVAFQGGPTRGAINGNPWLANEYLFAWEDLYGGGDRDYEDFVVLVESVVGVPEPASVATFGIGLLAFGLATRLRKASC